MAHSLLQQALRCSLSALPISKLLLPQLALSAAQITALMPEPDAVDNDGDARMSAASLSSFFTGNT